MVMTDGRIGESRSSRTPNARGAGVLLRGLPIRPSVIDPGPSTQPRPPAQRLARIRQREVGAERLRRASPSPKRYAGRG